MQCISDDQLQRAYRYAISLANDHDIAMDIVHTAYIRMLECDTASIENVQGYFFRCIRNIFIDKKRFDCRWLVLSDDSDDNGIDISTETLESTFIDKNLLEQIWKNLTVLERELLYLWAIEGYTIDEISHLTDTPRGTLLSRVHRIRKKVLNNKIVTESAYERTNKACY